MRARTGTAQLPLHGGRAPAWLFGRMVKLAREIPLVLLFFILFVWSPWSFAVELSATLPSIEMRGVPAVVELLAHGIVTALCAAAGWALLNRRAHAPLLARIGLVGSAAVSVQSLYWSALPRQTPPGSELPLAAIAVAHAAIWLVYVHRSSRMRAMAA